MQTTLSGIYDSLKMTFAFRKPLKTTQETTTQQWNGTGWSHTQEDPEQETLASGLGCAVWRNQHCFI